MIKFLNKFLPSRAAHPARIKKNEEVQLKQVEEILSRSAHLTRKLDDQIYEIGRLGKEDQALVSWFMNLTENQKQFVEMCADRGIAITPENFESVMSSSGLPNPSFNGTPDGAR